MSTTPPRGMEEPKRDDSLRLKPPEGPAKMGMAMTKSQWITVRRALAFHYGKLRSQMKRAMANLSGDVAPLAMELSDVKSVWEIVCTIVPPPPVEKKKRRRKKKNNGKPPIPGE